jgi:hypothetical protein
MQCNHVRATPTGQSSVRWCGTVTGSGEYITNNGLPPEKWSSVKYGFRADGGHWNGEEEAHGGGDRREASAS